MLFDKIVRDLSIDRVMEDTRFLTEETPMRLAGSDMERKAANYIKAQFDAAGVAMTVEEIDGYVSFPHSASVEVISPVRRTLKARAFAQAQPTPPEGLEAELVHVGSGGLPDYEGVDVRGKITLSELSYAPARPEKVRLATLNGSVGQIMMNWGLPEHNTIPMGTCKAVWGNPSSATFSQMPQIPAIGISRADGDWLAALAKEGPVKVRIFCDVENRWGKILMPHAQIDGAVEPEKFVLVAGHFDAWAGGATDNASGNAQIIELARVIKQHEGMLRRSVRFAFWPAHESGIMEGSSWYVDRYWDDLTRNCVCALNIDSAGMIGATEFQTDCSPELVDMHRKLIEKVLGIAGHKTRPLAHNGDQSFFGIGLPSLFAAHEHPEETKKLWNGASLGWWYHSEFDQMDKIDPKILFEGLRMSSAYVAELATVEVLPFDFAPAVERIETRIRELSSYDVGIDLASVAAGISTLKERAMALRAVGLSLAGANDPERTARYNDVLRRFSRMLTSVTGSVGGRWTQDTYALSALDTPLPGLFDIPKMAAQGTESAYYKLQWTDTVRQRNRIADGLTETNEMLAGYLDAA
jgi:hypothetical protein